jgi:hypothetical protein
MNDRKGKFSSKIIRKALRTLEPSLGRTSIDDLIYDLEIYGLPLASDHIEYSLEEVKVAIERVFGDATPLFLERFIKALNAVVE